MLKRRIIPIQLYDDGRLYKTKQFDSRRDVGHPVRSSQVYSDQNADELILLNIGKNRGVEKTFLHVISQISVSSFIPLTVGGGISSIDDASFYFDCGADKVVVNTCAYNCPSVVTGIAKKFGSQAVVAGVDVHKDSNGEYLLFSKGGSTLEKIGLGEHIKRVISLGVGEIFIQSIDRDGIMNGYDLELLSFSTKHSSVPVIIAGGAGHFIDLLHALENGADAVACGSLFNFGDNNPIRAKAFLKNYDIPLRST